MESALDLLVDAGLVFRRGRTAQAAYVFKHALVRDAAYESLLRSKRRHVHRRVARVLEAQFPEPAEVQPELLAHHYTGAGMAIEATEYWLQAGHRAAERSANAEAVGHLRKGLEVVAKIADKSKGQQYELEFLVALGAPLIATKAHIDELIEKVKICLDKTLQRIPDLVFDA